MNNDIQFCDLPEHQQIFILDFCKLIEKYNVKEIQGTYNYISLPNDDINDHLVLDDLMFWVSVVKK